MPFVKRWMNDATATLLCMALVIGSLALWVKGGDWIGIDFYQYWAVAQRLEDVASIGVYTGSARSYLLRWLKDKARTPGSTQRMVMIANCRDHFATYQTPFLYSLFYFCLSGNYDLNYRCYEAFLILCYVSGVLGMCYALKYKPEGMLAATLVLIHTFPFVTDVRLGNVNSFQFLLFALYLLVQTHSDRKYPAFIAGTVLGVMSVLKPTFAFVPLLLVITRAAFQQYGTLFRELAGMLCSGVTGIVVSSIVLWSPYCWIDWFMSVATVPENIISLEDGNFSLARPLWNSVGPAGPLFMSGLMVLAVSCVIRLGNLRSRASTEALDNGKRSDMAVAVSVSLGCLIYLLSSRLSWTHNFMLATPMILIGFRPFDSDRPEPHGQILVRRCLAGIAVLGLASLTVDSLLKWSGLMSAAVCLNMSAIGLFILGLLELLWNRSGPVT